MLGKLIKYDFKNIFKFISVFYIITLVLSILTRIFINTASPFFVFLIGRILSGATISLFANIIINCLMGLWIRSFARGLYGDESYLTHTLPVTKNQIYLSKIITAVAVSGISLAVILICAFIAYYTQDRWQYIKQLLLMNSSAKIIFLLVVILFLEFINLIQCGFTGIILGHRQNTAKTGLSVLFAFIAETVSQLIVVGFTGIAAVFSTDFKQLFAQNPTLTQDLIYTVVTVYITVYFAIILFTLWLNIKLLNKGVDIQ